MLLVLCSRDGQQSQVTLFSYLFCNVRFGYEGTLVAGTPSLHNVGVGNPRGDVDQYSTPIRVYRMERLSTPRGVCYIVFSGVLHCSMPVSYTHLTLPTTPYV